MEALNPSPAVLAERIRNQEIRIRSTHDGLGSLRKTFGSMDRAFAKFEEKLADQADDIAEMRKELRIIRWGLFSAIGVGLMFVVAVVTLIFQNA